MEKAFADKEVFDANIENNVFNTIYVNDIFDEARKLMHKMLVDMFIWIKVIFGKSRSFLRRISCWEAFRVRDFQRQDHD